MLVKGTTVLDDAANDTLSGGSDRDWFFRRNSGTGNQKDKMATC